MGNTKEELIERGALNVLNKILEYGNDYESEWLKFIEHEEIKDVKKIKQRLTRIDLTINTQDDYGIATFYYVLFQWWYNKVFFKDKNNRKVLDQFEKDVYSGLHVYSCQAKENVSNYIEMEQFMNIYISAYLKVKKNYKTLFENTRDMILQKLYIDSNIYDKKVFEKLLQKITETRFIIPSNDTLNLNFVFNEFKDELDLDIPYLMHIMKVLDNLVFKYTFWKIINNTRNPDVEYLKTDVEIFYTRGLTGVSSVYTNLKKFLNTLNGRIIYNQIDFVLNEDKKEETYTNIMKKYKDFYQEYTRIVPKVKYTQELYNFIIERDLKNGEDNSAKLTNGYIKSINDEFYKRDGLRDKIFVEVSGWIENYDKARENIINFDFYKRVFEVLLADHDNSPFSVHKDKLMRIE